MKKEVKEIITKWAVIWKRDRKILSLYGIKKTNIVSIDRETAAIFNRKSEAEKWRAKNNDWEVVLVEIKII